MYELIKRSTSFPNNKNNNKKLIKIKKINNPRNLRQNYSINNLNKAQAQSQTQTSNFIKKRNKLIIIFKLVLMTLLILIFLNHYLIKIKI